MRSNVIRMLVSAGLVGGALASRGNAQIEWGAAIQRGSSEVDVASRVFTDRREFLATGATYAFIGTGHPTELARQDTVHLPKAAVLEVVNAALQARGLKPAQTRDAVQLGIIVAFGTGALRPPYEFFRIDPDFETYRTWPTALQRLHRLYYAGSADDDDIDRVDTAEHVNYIKITAYDFQRFAADKKLQAVWATLITMPAKDKPLAGQFKSMVKLATPLLGTEARDGRTFESRPPAGDVKIGPTRVMPPGEGATADEPDVRDKR